MCKQVHSVRVSIIAAISMGGLLASVAQMTQRALCIEEIILANLLHMVHPKKANMVQRKLW